MHPKIHDNILTPGECERVIQAAQRLGLERSTVAEKSGNQTSGIRTSSHVFLLDSDPIAQTLKSKVHQLTGVSPSRMERVQVVHYRPGQEYKPHFDACNDGCDGGKDMPRTQTVMFYLNTVDQGGHTRFPNAGVSVAPKQGRAVHWYNIDNNKQNLPCAFHGADPVRRGEKWGATVWIR
jgi:prolyl 4-hydroxylase